MHLYYIIRNLATSGSHAEFTAFHENSSLLRLCLIFQPSSLSCQCYGLPQFSDDAAIDACLCRFKFQEIEVRFTSYSWFASDYAKTRCFPGIAGNFSGLETLTENAVRSCNRSSAHAELNEAGGV